MQLRSTLLFSILFCIAASNSASLFTKHERGDLSKHERGDAPLNRILYEDLHLKERQLSYEVFSKALRGYASLLESGKITRRGLLSIVDLSQSSNCERLYVIDLQKKELVYQTHVAHGRNSGEEYASAFGNRAQSFRSSLGFYVTGTTYNGSHGLAMKLKGCEAGINDKAEDRGIVMHGAAYVSEAFIRDNGRLGRSQGCPAVPLEMCEPVVNYIKEGSCLFIFHPDPHYQNSSSLLK